MSEKKNNNEKKPVKIDLGRTTPKPSNSLKPKDSKSKK